MKAQKEGGTIVAPGWITDCYKNKARLPETEYLLSEPSKKKPDKAMKNTMGNMREWLSSLKIPNKGIKSISKKKQRKKTNTCSSRKE